MRKQFLLLSTAFVSAALISGICIPASDSGPVSAAEILTVSEAEALEDSGAEAAEAPASDVFSIECGIASITKYGNIDLNIHGNLLHDLGYEVADIISVEIAGQTISMPIGTNYSDVDSGEYICVMITSENTEESYVTLAINMGDLAGTLGIAQKEEIEEEPGFTWVFNEGYDENLPIVISLEEKGGYENIYMMHNLQYSLNRADYPDLSDAEYANFRNIATSGMGKDRLYRSSSPVNPQINRNKEADAECAAHGIKTVINLADSDSVMRGYEGFGYTYYSGCNIIPLDLGVDFNSDGFRKGVADGLRFLTEHEGPYLVHCTEGKDRAGFVSAVLECLMGASADEVIADYMVTYYNYAGIEKGDPRYDAISEANICKSLQRAFGIEDIREADLATEAAKYLVETGLTEEEVAAVKECLG